MILLGDRSSNGFALALSVSEIHVGESLTPWSMVLKEATHKTIIHKVLRIVVGHMLLCVGQYSIFAIYLIAWRINLDCPSVEAITMMDTEPFAANRFSFERGRTLSSSLTLTPRTLV